MNGYVNCLLEKFSVELVKYVNTMPILNAILNLVLLH